jgi:hypothetical protein
MIPRVAMPASRPRRDAADRSGPDGNPLAGAHFSVEVTPRYSPPDHQIGCFIPDRDYIFVWPQPQPLSLRLVSATLKQGIPLALLAPVSKRQTREDIDALVKICALEEDHWHEQSVAQVRRGDDHGAVIMV